MSNETYNGWSNYNTWRVNLEIFDGMNPKEYFTNISSAYELSKELKEYVENYIEETSSEGLARDYAFAFLSEVNWHEIAHNMIDEYESGDSDDEVAA